MRQALEHTPAPTAEETVIADQTAPGLSIQDNSARIKSLEKGLADRTVIGIRIDGDTITPIMASTGNVIPLIRVQEYTTDRVVRLVGSQPPDTEIRVALHGGASTFSGRGNNAPTDSEIRQALSL